MANAHYEDTTEYRRHGIIRVFADGRKHGEPYLFHTCVVANDETAILKGLLCPGGFKDEYRSLIRKVLLASGFTHYARWRHRDGEAPRFVRIRL